MRKILIEMLTKTLWEEYSCNISQDYNDCEHYFKWDSPLGVSFSEMFMDDTKTNVGIIGVLEKLSDEALIYLFKELSYNEGFECGVTYTETEDI